jgi:hypothetical protein
MRIKKAAGFDSFFETGFWTGFNMSNLVPTRLQGNIQVGKIPAKK